MMLERAAGCLETAGQGLLRNCNSVLRCQKSLDTTFWKQRTYENNWPSISLPIDGINRNQQIQKCTNSARHTYEPFLDFLYPHKCLISVEPRQSRGRRGAIHNRNQRTSAASSLSFSRATRFLSSRRHVGSIGVPRLSRGAHTAVPASDGFARRQTVLDTLLDETNQQDNDRVWEMWCKSDKEPQLRSGLMAYLSRSQRFIDIERAISLLHEVAPNKRTADDYASVFVSLFSAGHASTVYHLCEAALTHRTKVNAFAIAFKISVTENRWEDALRFWRRAHDRFNHNSFGSFASLKDFPQRVLSLVEYMKGLNDLDTKLLVVLLDTMFGSKDIMADISVQTLLSLTREFNECGLLTQSHYERAIKTLLLKVNTRSSQVAAMVLYRNFRWHLSSCIPPTNILHLLLESLVKLGNHRGVQFLLDDFVRFYGRPSVEAYKIALTVFSRRGDTAKVRELFNDLVNTHGTPSTRHADHHLVPRTIKWVVPVLHSYALLGDYPRAIEEFNKIRTVYGLKPNTVAWNVLISAPANANNLKKTLRMFRRMRLRGPEPDAYTYGIVMGLCARLGNIKATLALNKMAQESNVGLSTHLLYPVIDVYCRSQLMQEAEQVAESSMSLEVTGPRTSLWDRLLWAYAFRADMDAVSRIHERMKEAKLQFRESTYGALMLSFCIVGRPDSARRILRGLQRSRTIHASEFLYTIVLYGFVKAGNRDMIHVIYKEMEERFENPGLSARLLMLRSTIGRDTIKTLGEFSNSRLARSEDYLFQAIFDFDRTQSAIKSPRPGTSSLPINQAFPSLYYEPVLKAYSAEGLHERNERLLAEYEADIEAAKAAGQNTFTPSLRFLSVLMEVNLQAGKLEAVQDCWKMAQEQALTMAREVNIQSLTMDKKSLLQPASATGSAAVPGEQKQDSQPETAAGHDETTTTPVEHATPSGPYYLDKDVVPAQAYILSRHLSLYIRALGESGQTNMLPDLIKSHIRRGYSLTSANWLTYVRTLAASLVADEQIHAFTTFERIFMPAFPGWRRLRRGAQLRPPNVPRTIDLLDMRGMGDTDSLGKAGTRLWTKVDPTWKRPTYNVMVYLASALREFKQRSLYVGSEEMDNLYNAAPNTLEALAAMPPLKEKFQGVLLRDHPEGYDRVKRSPEPYVWTGGVLGVDGHRRPKLRSGAEHERYELSETQTDVIEQAGAQELSQKEDYTEVEEYDPADIHESERLQAPEDEHDIELETTIETKRREFGIDPVRREALQDRKK